MAVEDWDTEIIRSHCMMMIGGTPQVKTEDWDEEVAESQHGIFSSTLNPIEIREMENNEKRHIELDDKCCSNGSSHIRSDKWEPALNDSCSLDSSSHEASKNWETELCNGSPYSRADKLKPGLNDSHCSTGSSSPSTTETWMTDLLARSHGYQELFIDSHCHIDFLYTRLGVSPGTKYEEFRNSYAHSWPVNYEGCVAVFCDPSTFDFNSPKDDVVQTVAEEEGVWLTFGCHPKSATRFCSSHEHGLRKILKHPKVVALGEIGLDYSGTFSQHAEVQKEVLVTQIKLAIEMDLPLVIHCRDAHDDLLEIMQKHVPQDHKIHLHCFTADPTTAERWLSAFPNLVLGLTPLITYKSAKDVIQSATYIPLDRLVLETDAPYFVPSKVNRKTVKLSHPGFALFTAERIAQLRGIPVDDVLKACRENTRRVYGI